MENCSADYYDYGGTDDSKFDEPLPWIGLYVALASLACAVLMAVDLFHNFKRRTPWFVSKFFAFNVITITLLGKATKLPSDITGGMPGLVDQLTKLSGLLLLRGAMDHAKASLGAMDRPTASYNMIALGIMVASMFTNICIQLKSGVIFNNYFRCIYIYYSVDMLVLFLILVFHTLSFFPLRMILDEQYYKKHEIIFENIPVDGRFSYDNLCKYVTGYWLMAVTSSPDYALNTSQLAVALSCMNGYSSVLIFVFGIIFVSGKIKDGNNPTCFVRSYYSWSTWLIFVIQVFTIAVGCATSFQRIVRAIQLKEWVRTDIIETYMDKFVMDLNDAPLPTRDTCNREAMHRLREICIKVLRGLLRLVMIASCFIVAIHLFFATIMTRIITFCRSPRISNNYVRLRDNDVRESPYGDMSDYILYLTDEKDVEQSTKTARILQKYPTMWIDGGRDNPPINLESFLKNDSLPESFGLVRLVCSEQISSTEVTEPPNSRRLSEAFEAVHEFYSEQIPLTEYPNCWAMPIVTLASILFLHGNYRRREEMKLAVGESLRYIRLVDRNMDERGTGRMQKAADIVWEKLDLQKRLWNVDCDHARLMTFTDLITHLRDEAGKEVHGHCNGWEYWPPKLFIKKCMCATTDVILKSLENEEGSSKSVWSVERLEKVMVGLLGACLTNLPRAIFKHCSSGTFGLREEKVKKAAVILGETREIIKLLDYIPADKKYIESWCGRSPFPQSCASSPVSHKSGLMT